MSEKIDLDAKVKELAKLSALEFDQVYEDEADRLGVRRSTLDREVKKARRAKKNGADEDFLSDPAPWPDPVDGATLLGHISDTAASHVILPDGGAETIALVGDEHEPKQFCRRCPSRDGGEAMAGVGQG